MLVVSEVSARSGSIVSKTSPRSSSVWLSANTIKCFWRQATRYVKLQLLSLAHANKFTTESHDGKFGPFRLRRQLEMVYENIYHPFPQQSRSVQTKAGQVTPIQLLPRLFGWKRRKPRCKVPTLEIQSGQQGTSKSIPSVSRYALSSRGFYLADYSSVSHKRPIRQISVWCSQL